MQKVLVTREEGLQNWFWQFPGTQDELISSFIKGEAPLHSISPLSGKFRGRIRELAYDEDNRLSKKADAFIELIEGIDTDYFRLSIKGRNFFAGGNNADDSNELPVFILNLTDGSREISVWSHLSQDVSNEFLERPRRLITQEIASIEEVKVCFTDWLCLHESMMALAAASGKRITDAAVLSRIVPTVLDKAAPLLTSKQLFRAYRQNHAVRWLCAAEREARRTRLPEVVTLAEFRACADRVLESLDGWEREFYFALCHPGHWHAENRLRYLEPVAKAFETGEIPENTVLGRLLKKYGEREELLAKAAFKLWLRKLLAAAKQIES